MAAHRQIILRLAFFLLSLSSVSRLYGQERPSVHPEESRPLETPAAMLETSYRLEDSADVKDRAYLLALIGGVAGSEDSVKCQEWSKELFRIAFQLPLTWDRVAYEKNALVNLSYVDPKQALTLMPRLDNPVPMPDGSLPEDVRADAATTIFAHAWQNAPTKKTLEAITEEADLLSATGQYPYEGMAPIIVDVIKRDEMQGDLLFRKAVGSYRMGSKSIREDSDFVSMIEMAWPSLNLSLRRVGLAAAVDRLLSDRKKLPATTVSFSLSVTSAGSAQFTSKERGLLYRLLPKIHEVDPAWEKQLEEDMPDLKQGRAGAGRSLSSSDVRVEGAGSDATTSEMMAFASQMATFNSAMALAGADPTRAIQLSSGLPRVEQTAVLMQVASGYIYSNPSKAREIFDQTETQIEMASDSADVLKLLSIRAAAAQGLDGNSVTKDAVAKAYDLGEELVTEQLLSHPGIAVHEIRFLLYLETASNVGIRVAKAESLRRIQKIQTPVLEALLLTDAATVLSQSGQQELHPQAEDRHLKTNR